MTALIVNDTEDVNAAGGAISISEPTGLAVAELLLAFLLNVEIGGAPPAIPPLISGFTSSMATYGTDPYGLRVCHRVADGTEGPTYTSTPSAGSYSVGKLLRILGAHTESPIAASGVNSGLGTTVTLPSVAAPAGRPVLAVAMVTGALVTLNTVPSGWTLYDLYDSNFEGIFFRLIDGGQSSGAGTITLSGSGSWVAQVVLIALDPSYPGIAGMVTEIGTSLGSANAQPTFAAPAHAGAAGDLCLYLVGHDNPGATNITASTGWTVLNHTTQGSNVIKGALIARILDGAHGTGNNTLSVTGTTQDYGVIGLIIPANSHSVVDVSTDIVAGTPSTAASGNTDPPNAAAVASQRFLALTGCVVDATTSDAITGWPSNYGYLVTVTSASSTSSVMAGLAARNINASSENPGAWAHNSQENIGFTWLIPARRSRVTHPPTPSYQRDLTFR